MPLSQSTCAIRSTGLECICNIHLIILLVSMSIKFVKSVFDIVIEAMSRQFRGIHPFQILRSIKSCFGQSVELRGIFFEVVIMRVRWRSVVTFLPICFCYYQTIRWFFDGLNMWEQCWLLGCLYRSFFAASKGEHD